MADLGLAFLVLCSSAGAWWLGTLTAQTREYLKGWHAGRDYERAKSLSRRSADRVG